MRTVLRQYIEYRLKDWRVLPREPVGMHPLITLRPRQGMVVRLQRRQAARAQT